jgi:ribosome biogenesis GTPase
MISNTTRKGLDQLTGLLQTGKTYCVVGSSGVGKSTLINNLLKKNILKTAEISLSTNKGKHTTDHRELFVLENGAIIIDTPGMRELGITESGEGIKTTYQEIFDLSLKCKFPDCKHVNESGCAVIEALDNGTIDGDSLENFRKMLREQQRFQTTVAERRRKEREFGKMVRNVLNQKKNNPLL